MGSLSLDTLNSVPNLDELSSIESEVPFAVVLM